MSSSWVVSSVGMIEKTSWPGSLHSCAKAVEAYAATVPAAATDASMRVAGFMSCSSLLSVDRNGAGRPGLPVPQSSS